MSGIFSNSLRSPDERKRELGMYLTRARDLNENFSCHTAVANINDVIEKEDEVINETSLEEKIKNQGEVIIDSEIMTCASKIIEQCTISISKDINTYNSEEYAEMILDYVQQMSDTIADETPGDINWRILELEIERMFKKTPHFSTLSGALDTLPKKAIEKRAPNKRDVKASTKRPEKVVATDKDDMSVEQTVEKIRKLIIRHHKENNSPIDYFRLILHPTNFPLTIENMLHVSFLVRDGLLQLKQDDSTGALMIYPCKKEMTALAKKSGKSGCVQNIIYLNKNQWQILIAHYGISQPMINFTSGEQ